MKLRVGYIQCEETAIEGSLDQTLIRVMDCGGSATNGGGGSETYYTNGATDIKYLVDPIVDYPPPPVLTEDQPAPTLDTPIETITPAIVAPMEPVPETTPGGSGNNMLLIAGGGLLLWFLIAKKKKRKR